MKKIAVTLSTLLISLGVSVSALAVAITPSSSPTGEVWTVTYGGTIAKWTRASGTDQPGPANYNATYYTGSGTTESYVLTLYETTNGLVTAVASQVGPSLATCVFYGTQRGPSASGQMICNSGLPSESWTASIAGGAKAAYSPLA